MNKLITSAVAKNGSYFDPNTNTLYMSNAYNKKRLNYGSDEYKAVRELRTLIPDLKIEIVTRAPKKKPLSYDMMKKFIMLLPTAEADLKEMECQQKMSVSYKSPYKYMELWFNEKYPFHKELLVSDSEWDVVSLMRLADAQKKEKEAAPAEEETQAVEEKTSESAINDNIINMSTSDVIETTFVDDAASA